MNGNSSPDFELRGGASEATLTEAEAKLRWILPTDYKRFLRAGNGGEGFVGQNYLILWGAEDLAEFNKDYQVEEYAPGLTLFGSDGGGEGFAFDRRTNPPQVVRVPFIGMSLEYARVLAPTFEKFLEKLKAEP